MSFGHLFCQWLHINKMATKWQIIVTFVFSSKFQSRMLLTNILAISLCYIVSNHLHFNLWLKMTYFQLYNAPEPRPALNPSSAESCTEATSTYLIPVHMYGHKTLNKTHWLQLYLCIFLSTWSFNLQWRSLATPCTVNK